MYNSTGAPYISSIWWKLNFSRGFFLLFWRVFHVYLASIPYFLFIAVDPTLWWLQEVHFPIKTQRTRCNENMRDKFLREWSTSPLSHQKGFCESDINKLPRKNDFSAWLASEKGTMLASDFFIASEKGVTSPQNKLLPRTIFSSLPSHEGFCPWLKHFQHVPCRN